MDGIGHGLFHRDSMASLSAESLSAMFLFVC